MLAMGIVSRSREGRGSGKRASAVWPVHNEAGLQRRCLIAWASERAGAIARSGPRCYQSIHVFGVDRLGEVMIESRFG